jgi:Protein of unknown function (DUF3574)
MRRAALVLVLFAACAHDVWISERLYFGRSIPGGGAVSDAEWDAFVRDVVTPRFPAGLTIHAAHGQWREESGTIAREPVMVIEILHPPGEAAERAIEEIIRAYREKFRQEAVLRVRARARVSFGA